MRNSIKFETMTIEDMKIEIRFNKETSTFFTTLFDEKLSDQDLNILKSKIKEYLKSRTDIKWVPMLRIQEASRYNTRDHLDIGIYFRGEKKLGDDTKMIWAEAYLERVSDDEPDKYDISNYKIRRTYNYDIKDESTLAFLPYTPETYKALEYINRKINACMDGIKKILSSDNCPEYLSNVDKIEHFMEIGKDDKKM
jgi:hypothetical protein